MDDSTPKLLSLPPEIRNRIYTFVLSIPRNDLCQRHLPDLPRVQRANSCSNDPRSPNLSVLLVCKQIYIEAYHIFSHHNELHFDNTTRLLNFLRRIGYARRQQLRVIFFHEFDDQAKKAFRLLRTCPKLTRVRLIFPTRRAALYPPGYAALREVRGLQAVDMHGQGRSFFGPDYRKIVQPWEIDPVCNPTDLERAMMRPRLKRFVADSNKKINLFHRRREVFRSEQDEVFRFEQDDLRIRMNW